jgi:hypothetical protein
LNGTTLYVVVLTEQSFGDVNTSIDQAAAVNALTSTQPQAGTMVPGQPIVLARSMWFLAVGDDGSEVIHGYDVALPLKNQGPERRANLI